MAATAAAAAAGACAHGGDDEHIPLGPVPSYSRQQSKFTGSNRTTASTRDPRGNKKSFKSLKRSVTKGVADFFLGDHAVEDGDEDPQSQEEAKAIARQKWRNRSILLHSNRLIGGRVKDEMESVDAPDSVFDAASQASSQRHGAPPTPATAGATCGPHVYDPLHRPYGRQDSKVSRGSKMSKSFTGPSRQISHISTASSSRRSARPLPRRLSRKDSVVKMAYDGLKDFVGGSRKVKRKPLTYSRSFAPVSVTEDVYDDIDTMKRRSPIMGSAFTSDESVLDDVFFDNPTPTSARLSPFNYRRTLAPPSGMAGEPATPESLPTIQEKSPRPSDVTTTDTTSPGTKAEAGDKELPPQRVYVGGGEDCPGAPPMYDELSSTDISVPVEIEFQGVPEDMRPTKSGWRISKQMEAEDPAAGFDTPDGGFEVMGRIKDKVLDAALDNSDRREIGKGFFGGLFGERKYRMDRLNSEIRAQMEAIDDHRPYFTYWVTFVQIVIYIISVSVYGIAPIGFEETLISAEVRKPNLALEKVSYFEQDNLWIGPRHADLVHLGAKYSPCMRLDENIDNKIENFDKVLENQTACCVRNDGSGCVQMSEGQCSSTLSTWDKWTSQNPGEGGRVSGSVCGQHPKYCKSLPSDGAFVWPDDITKWPICEESLVPPPSDPAARHMNCSLSGRPCCVGIQGQCIITTREYCQFRNGYFHEEAALCSQVSCMNEICGMIPFLDPANPDQFYRLWTSLFLHAGLIQLVFTVLFQFFIMRDMEKLAGWLRICIIYIGSGIAGSLASAIFLPYHVEAAPSGSQFGILASLFVEVIQNWYILANPKWALGKLLIILVTLFILGLLPYIDNYAHLIGFVFGFLLSFALLPYIDFNKLDRRGKIIGIVICLVTAVGLFALLIVLFYVTPVYHCPYCHYFNCIPFTPKFCQSMELKIGREVY